MPPLPSLLTFTRSRLSSLLTDMGETRSFRVSQLSQWIWQKRVADFQLMSDLPPALREALAAHFTLRPVRVVRRSVSGTGGTRKMLCEMQDGELVEMVLLPAAMGSNGSQSSRLTLCLSSQVGCAFGCKFCASGLYGFKRNLTSDELLGQIFAAEDEAGCRADNLVFMGMGEPLANTESLIPALRQIISPDALALSPRHITISTSGNVPGLRVLADSGIPVRLAVSLHGASDEIRSRIMPVNRRWPLTQLLPALEAWLSASKHLLTLEYILISGVNDQLSQATQLADIARRLRAKVNLIPYNPVQELPWKRPPESTCRAFFRALHALRIPVTMRYEKGTDIRAACGQLRAASLHN